MSEQNKVPERNNYGARPQNLGAFASTTASPDPQKPSADPAQKKQGMLARYCSLIFKGGLSLLTGMKVTILTFINPKTVVTQQYPENRETLKMAERFRGQVIMPHNDEGEHNCTACTLCEKACPNGSINVLPTKNIAGKKILGKYIYRLDTCTICALCVEACPFDAIRMGRDFELATLDKRSLEMVLNKKEGRWKS